MLSLLPGRKQVIRDIFQNYWDFQDRWNQQMPAYARDMVTVAIKTAPQEVRQFSQIPILAWGVERVYQRNRDQELLKQLAADQLPDCQRPGRLRACRPRRRHRRQDHRQRDQERDQRTLRLDLGQAVGRERLLHEQHFGRYDA